MAAVALPALLLFSLSCQPVTEESDSTNPEPAASATEEPAPPPPTPEPEIAAAAPPAPASTDPPAGEMPSEDPAPVDPEPTPTEGSPEPAADPAAAAAENLAIATFGNGCFWCTEAVLERLEGVAEVVSGYMGGHVENPTYEQVCSKTTGHAEVVQVKYDPEKITYDDLLYYFWGSHDPTTKDRQGNDIGPQYRSVIFYHSPEQKAAAENSMAKENASGKHGAPIVTEITEASTFWVAEEEHQDFFARNPWNGYCRLTIPPKLKKLGLE